MVKISLALQSYLITKKCPNWNCKIVKSCLICNGNIKPTELSSTYEVKLVYTLGRTPRLWVVNPSLQLLAKEMEISSPTELNADIITTLHVAPKENEDLMRYIPNQELRSFGRNIHDIWTNIAECGKFKGIYTKDLLDIITSNKIAPDNTWSSDIKQRYNF